MIEPSDLYFKAKRWLVLASGSLLLSLTVGLDVSGTTNGFLPIPITDKTKLNIVIFLIVVYFIAQFQIHWISQNLEVREKTQFKFDYFTTLGISFAAVASYIFSLVTPFAEEFYARLLDTTDVENIFGRDMDGFSFISAVLAGLTSGLAAIAITGVWATLFSKYRKLLQIRMEESRAAASSAHELLLGEHWVLNFNPRHPKGRKKISFLDNGSIGDGRNHNESTWRMRNEFLEILNDEGKIFSRFKFDTKTKSFFHTNDEDTLSLRDQELTITA